MDEAMPAQPLIDQFTIFMLLDELAGLGLSDAEVDLLIVRQGPVDLDLLQECKRLHPAFGRKKTSNPQRRMGRK
ncbi:hypothetical protein [Nitratireductor soli]|uniref:hypothetical protein n=1 Tax=Nitratireductor soli TaxID=1670619 RepID=UPI00065E1715|nr:hypothetical protein [Nitratireductor soli]